MSGDRAALPSDAVDQSVRANQPPPEEITIETPEDVIEGLRATLRELEERDRKRDAEIAEERRRRTEERARADAAEAKARQADQRANVEAETGRRSTEDAQLSEIVSSLNARNAEMEALKGQQAAAYADGDGGKMADVQAKMAVLGGEIAQLTAGQKALEARKQTREQQPAQPVSVPDDPRDIFIRNQPAIVQDWLRDHPQYFTDTAFQRRVAAAANYASQVKGIDIGSQEYIDFVNDEVGLTERRQADSQPREQSNGRGRDADPDEPRDTGANQRRADQAHRRLTTAPAGGSVPSASATTNLSGGDRVVLTAEERAFARSQGIDETEYARHKRDLQREGLIGVNARR